MVTVVEYPSWTEMDVIVLESLGFLNVLEFMVEPPQGSVTVTVKETWSLAVFTSKVVEPAGPFEAITI